MTVAVFAAQDNAMVCLFGYWGQYHDPEGVRRNALSL